MMNILWRLAIFVCGLLAGLAIWEFIVRDVINEAEFLVCITLIAGCCRISYYYIRQLNVIESDDEE